MSLNVTSAIQLETTERFGFSQESSCVRQMSQSMLSYIHSMKWEKQPMMLIFTVMKKADAMVLLFHVVIIQINTIQLSVTKA